MSNQPLVYAVPTTQAQEPETAPCFLRGGIPDNHLGAASPTNAQLVFA